MMRQIRQLIQINKNKTITNNIIRVIHLGANDKTNIETKCIDCKHYVLNIAVNNDNTKLYDYANATCRKFRTKNIDTNQMEYANAYISRSERILCGSLGLHFSKKEPIKPN